MAWAATTSFETTDGSTSPTDGNAIAGTGDGSGWTGNWTNYSGTSSYQQYDNGVSGIPDGSWAHLIDTYTAHVNNEPGVYRSLSSGVTSGRVSFYVRTNVDNRDNPFVGLRNSSHTRGPGIILEQTTTDTPRNLTTSGGTSIATSVIAKNTWYKIDIDFDCTTDTFDVYLDGTKKNGTALSFENALTTADELAIANNAASGFSSTIGVMMWVDKIANGAVASGPTYLKTRDTIAKASVKTIDGIAIASVKTIDTIGS